MDKQTENRAKKGVNTHFHVLMLVEGALMVAMAYVLDILADYIPFLNLPDGGTISLKMLPIVFFAIRYGCGWGALVGLVFGAANYFLGFPKSIDWTSAI